MLSKIMKETHFQLVSPIKFNRFPNDSNSKFSILIPSWNNHEHLILLVNSIKKNSTFEHQICVHLNEDQTGLTRAFLEEMKISYSISEKNVGVCYGFNAAYCLAENELIVFMDDDMYVAPKWDEYLLNEINKQSSIYWAISGTMIERYGHNPATISPYNFGDIPANFEEDRFLREFASIPFDDWSGASWYPMALHRDVWNLVGGLSVEFSPGMYSDPDFMKKLWQLGVREFKGIASCRVYHFISKSTQRVKRNNGRLQFFKKWHMSSSVFTQFYIALGASYTGKRALPQGKAFERALLKDKFKRWFTF